MSNRSAFKPHLLSRNTAFLAALVACLPLLEAQDDLGDKLRSESCRIFSERKDAVVQVEAYDPRGKLSGTGFFIDPSGTIFTLSYIVGNAREIFVVRGDCKIPARLLVADPRSGVALIKADVSTPFIPVGDSHKLSLASPVMTIGFPSESSGATSLGIVGGFDRKFLGKYFTTTHIRAVMPVEAGFGGAPLLNLQGQAVGIIISGINNASCYAVPIEAAEKIRMDYARFGEARHGWLGVNAEEQEEPVEGSHVRIAELGPNTPAAKSGLHNGDILLQVGGVKINEPEDIIDASFFLTAGDKVNIVVIRNGEKINIETRSVKHPATDVPAYAGDAIQQLHVLLPDASTGTLNLGQ